MKQTYQGSCHCGAVRIEARFDLAEGTRRCNCSFCTKARVWEVIVPAADLRLLAGADQLQSYRFGQSFDHPFCRRCGTRPFGTGHVEELGGDIAWINVACLDGVDPTLLAEAPRRFPDGRNDRWWEEAAETRHL